MASGGSTRARVGVLVAVGCVAVAVIVAALGALPGSHHAVTASTGRGPATTPVTTPPPADPGPTADVEADPAGAQPEVSPSAKGSDPIAPAAPPEAFPTAGLPTEVAQALTEMAAQLERTGDDGRPREMSREEVDALVTAQLRALGIEL